MSALFVKNNGLLDPASGVAPAKSRLKANITLLSSGWVTDGSGKVSQTVSVTGLTTTMTILPRLVQSSDLTMAQAESDAWTGVLYSKMSIPNNGSFMIQLFDATKKPSININAMLIEL